MESAYISAVSALAGSAIGALSSFATTWLTQSSARRVDRAEKDRARREALYSAFIEEASALFIDALTHEFHDATKLVKLYDILSRIRLAGGRSVIAAGEDVMKKIVETYYAPNIQFSELRAGHEQLDPLKAFAETCREEISSI